MNNYKSNSVNNKKKIIEHLHNALFYHNYSSNNNRNIELIKGKYYDIIPRNDLNTNNTNNLNKNKGDVFMISNIMFLGCPEKKILRYMPESGKLENRKSKMCHFFMEGNDPRLMEIDANHIKRAIPSKFHTGGKKTSRKNMKGGEESWGATGMPAQFYNPKKPLVGYPANSGFGVPTAYGPSNPLDVGTGLLAPFTASKSPTANLATMNKTGGAKKKIKRKTTTKTMKKKITKTKKDKKGTKLPMKKKAKKISPNKKAKMMKK